MKYDLQLDKNPNFQTVNSLTNKTWDPENVPIVSGRGATEDQLQVVDGRIFELSRNVPECDDEPFTHLKARVDAMEEAIADCSDDPFFPLRDRVDRIENEFDDCNDDPWYIMVTRLNQMEERQINCCNIPHDTEIAIMRNKINELAAAIQNCCDSVTPVVPIP